MLDDDPPINAQRVEDAVVLMLAAHQVEQMNDTPSRSGVRAAHGIIYLDNTGTEPQNNQDPVGATNTYWDIHCACHEQDVAQDFAEGWIFTEQVGGIIPAQRRLERFDDVWLNENCWGARPFVQSSTELQRIGFNECGAQGGDTQEIAEEQDNSVFD